jgi:hypothetical protein
MFSRRRLWRIPCKNRQFAPLHKYNVRVGFSSGKLRLQSSQVLTAGVLEAETPEFSGIESGRSGSWDSRVLRYWERPFWKLRLQSSQVLRAGVLQEKIAFKYKTLRTWSCVNNVPSYIHSFTQYKLEINQAQCSKWNLHEFKVAFM